MAGTHEHRSRRHLGRRFLALSALVTVGAIAAAASGQQPEPESPLGQPGLAAPAPAALGSRELEGIRTVLERIADLLERQNDQNEVEVLFRRIELKNDRLLPLETALRAVLAEIARTRDERERIEIFDDNATERLAAAESEGERRAIQGDQVQLAFELVRLDQQLGSLREQEQLLELDRRQLMAEIEELEEWLDREHGTGLSTEPIPAAEPSPAAERTPAAEPTPAAELTPQPLDP
jgi:hypothetical protein